ncbi:class I adenylate-forming enzyme family protein [Nocardioides sp. L-11A]|uniref:class I adenylate-forming enzyme family protein n=1 Tax=Nocardioides sp. L-11A TaxID=3043848 RepID=UPI00249A1D0A|nr:AMP-binding protein [Nocardioides sp. L-11A]
MTDGGLPGLLHGRAAAGPETPFLTWQGEVLTYGHADELVRVLASALMLHDSRGGGSGRIAVYAANSPGAVLVWLASQAAGLVPVTLNRAQLGRPLAEAVRRSRASVLIADPDGAPTLQGAAGPETRVLVLDGDHGVGSLIGSAAGSGVDAATRQGPVALPAPVEVQPGDAATIMFSSGTTGTAKGVVIPHGMFVSSSRRLVEAWGIGPDDVLHCWAPWFHVAAQVDVFALALQAGASVALFEGFSASRFWQQIHDSGATVFGGFVSVLEMLNARPPGDLDRAHRLRLGVAGHVPRALRRTFEERFGVPLLDAYGMSEAEPLTMPRVELDLPDGSCGPANPDFEIQIHDAHGILCPPGVEGQIVFRPRREHVMMLGYLDDPERTAAAWRDGWFLTGDLGTLDERGWLSFRDRMAEFIRVRGENVSPQEVESVLMEHPGVAEVGVVGVASELGEHDVKAVIVPRPGTSLAGLTDWCSTRMAPFMVPRWVQVVDVLPRTPTSKVRRPELRDLAGPVQLAADLPS